MDEEEQWRDIATYTGRVCAIALVADRTFASDFTVNVTGKKMFVSAASMTPKPLRVGSRPGKARREAWMGTGCESQRAGNGCFAAELTAYHLVGRCRHL